MLIYFWVAVGGAIGSVARLWLSVRITLLTGLGFPPKTAAPAGVLQIWSTSAGQVITNALAWLPNWAGAAILLALIGGLAWYALRQVGARSDESEEREATASSRETETHTIHTQEESVELQDSEDRAEEEEHHTSKEGSLSS